MGTQPGYIISLIIVSYCYCYRNLPAGLTFETAYTMGRSIIYRACRFGRDRYLKFLCTLRYNQFALCLGNLVVIYICVLIWCVCERIYTLTLYGPASSEIIGCSLSICPAIFHRKSVSQCSVLRNHHSHAFASCMGIGQGSSVILLAQGR